jgi:hypothetical protein
MRVLLFLFAGITASHGQLRFRPHMMEDWIIYGTPTMGIAGFIVVTTRLIRNRNKCIKGFVVFLSQITFILPCKITVV